MSISQDGRQIMTRIEPEKYELLAWRARDNHRSMAAELRLAVDVYLGYMDESDPGDLLKHDAGKQGWLTARLKRA